MIQYQAQVIVRQLLPADGDFILSAPILALLFPDAEAQQSHGGQAAVMD